MSEMLNIVDNDGKIIGVADRVKIHTDGLLHREINIWLYTRDGKLIFQRRASNKDTFPGLLDASVGGHVEVGADWMDTALLELKEETGLEREPEDLQYLTEIRIDTKDAGTKAHNRSIQKVYITEYAGKVSELRVEAGKGSGFEAWDIDRLLTLSPEEKKQFLFPYLKPHYPAIFEKIKQEIGQ